MRCRYRGPAKPKILFVGEAPSKKDCEIGLPFMGSSGTELSSMLKMAKVNIGDCAYTNVFMDYPPGGEIEALFQSEIKHGAGYKFGQKKLYLHPNHQYELERLAAEIRDATPNIVVALGATALWALSGEQGLSALRGTTMPCTLVPGQKLLATYSPAAIFRNWAWRPIAIMDLIKVGREAAFPEIIRPEREVWIEPTLEDIEIFIEKYLRSAPEITYDIETMQKTITCIGFADGPGHAIVIPFFDSRKPDKSYWPDATTEVKAWNLVKKICQLPQRKVAQNGMYDLQYIWKTVGIPVKNAGEDTMLLHHAMYPELQKSLGFLGSIYTNEGSWKIMRKVATSKRDE